MRVSEQTGNEALQLLLEYSAALDLDVTRLIEASWTTSSRRQLVCLAFCKGALEHAVSQRALIGIGNIGTALALIRLQFETVVRAAWIEVGASDAWLDAFTSSTSSGDLKEPHKGPPIPAMLDSVGKAAPSVAQELRRLNETVQVMHSYVHGGVHLVSYALTGFPVEKLKDVIRNRNLLQLILCNVMIVASQKGELQGTVGRLSKAHARCMPPPTPWRPHQD